MAAAAVNGHPHTTPSADHQQIAAHDHKRKRDDPTTTTGTGTSEARIKQAQLDILQVLQTHDTTPSFLQHPLTPGKASSEEPSQKKARLSDSSGDNATIQTKLSNTRYTSLQQLKADASTVSEDLTVSIRSKASERNSGNAGRPTVEELKQIHRIHSLENLIKETVDREAQYIEAKRAEDVKPKKEDSGLSDAQEADTKSGLANARAGTVLTLFGNAPTPKQLFSSMQNARNVSQQTFVKSELPVDEMPLPPGLTATKVMSAPADQTKKGPTFDQAFAPPYSLAALQPPKAHKRSSTRDNSLAWEFKDPIQRNKKGGYTVQPLTVSTWLDYGGLDGEEPVSPRERRKQRDRALSTSGETAETPDKELSVEALKRQEEALFRKAFSSFAPSRDDSNAVVPEEVKDLVWWHKVGNKRFNDTFAIDPALLDETSTSDPPMETIEDEFKEEDFGKVIEDLDELEKTAVAPDPEPVTMKTDVEQVLREVSELLETLASHQRIRNSTLPTSNGAARTPMSPAPLTAAKIGKPDEPSDEEISTYNNLRRELAYLILKLPPYAVAKLDGDQLSDLGVSKLLTFQSQDVKGTLEEDQVTRSAKAQAQATANSIANLARPNSSAGQHYNTTAQRTPAIGQAANTRYGQQYGQRTPAPATSLQRQTSNQSYATPTAAPRPSYLSQNQYTRPGAAPPSYHQPQQYHQQRPPQQGGYLYNQQYQQTPVQQRPNYPSQNNQQYQQYQQRSHTAAANAVGYQTNSPAQQQYYQNRTASPSKPGYPTPMHQQPTPQTGVQRPIAQAPPQPQQPGSGRATPVLGVNYPSQPHTPVNGFAPPPRQPQPGLAPRPSSSTPQPSPYQAPPGQMQQPAAIQANGQS
ncbi:uncharacterized protein MYCFIDRAFT_158097 [Pseudocercospora fijiensis CIRAD86]|uniref:Uncharacterized protein n=1 Tax=Pseudocercospora fijiensis (strain CIRAD86) TaxID=383855 RepID=M2YKC4_PSEFD|nr:uncharacterized protein MYCFIDRAFT_158097 [Pseudocercospora fijiensis CIRAD86]EME78200.1 hypothetical protein MYCFIDRAFT_158097 [Pseudocercospora fijiensis CIRAD86]